MGKLVNLLCKYEKMQIKTGFLFIAVELAPGVEASEDKETTIASSILTQLKTSQ